MFSSWKGIRSKHSDHGYFVVMSNAIAHIHNGSVMSTRCAPKSELVMTKHGHTTLSNLTHVVLNSFLKIEKYIALF